MTRDTGLLKEQKDAPVNASMSQSFFSSAVLDHLWRAKKKAPLQYRLSLPEREAQNLVVCKNRDHGTFLPGTKVKKKSFVCVMDFILTQLGGFNSDTLAPFRSPLCP
jgi:hypothetical protein